MSTLFGVNVPYLRGEYGHDLAPNPRHPTWPCRFDPLHAYRPLIEARGLGFRAVRMWLCENAEGIVVDDAGRVTGVSERLLDAVSVVQEAAALHGLYLYWNLLDGNAWPREGDAITRSILADADQAARFAEAVAPLVRRMDPRLTLGLDVINEPESSTAECIEDPEGQPVPWEQIGHAIATVGDAARAERPLMITTGTMHVFLPRLWRSGAKLDAIDIHIYHPHGGLPSREDLATYVEDDALLDPALPLIGGELGVPKTERPEDAEAMPNYVQNARALGYHSAFLWQLDGDLIDKTSPKRVWSGAGARVHAALIDQ